MTASDRLGWRKYSDYKELLSALLPTALKNRMEITLENEQVVFCS